MATSLSPKKAPVLIAVDLQAHSSLGLRQGLALAKERNTAAIVLHVAHESTDNPGFYRAHASRKLPRPLQDIAEAMLNEFLKSELDQLPAEDQPSDIEQRLVQGIPATRIAEVAEQVDACCIVLVSTGYKGLSRLWHGSVVESLKKTSGRELLILDPPANGLPESGQAITAHSSSTAH